MTAPFIDAKSRRVFSGNLLFREDLGPLSDNSEVSRFLLEQSLLDLDGHPITGPDPESDEHLADLMAEEAIYAIERSDSPSSYNWYTTAIDRMIAVAALLHPEIQDDRAAREHPSGFFRDSQEARTVLFAAMAITSQSNKVMENMRFALEQYRIFLERGSFEPKVYGTNGAAIESNLARFNFILSRANGDLTRVRKLLSLKMKMSDLQAVARKYDINLPGKELADETVYGSMLFGPKVGNGFYQNLIGEYSPITIDLWFMRMWGRYTGTILREEITGDSRERLVRGVRRSLKSARLKAMMEEEGVALQPAAIAEMDAQALLEYSKKLKRFWEKMRKRFVSGQMSRAYTTRNDGKKGPSRQNAEASELKAHLMWPGAAESIVKSMGMPTDSPRNASMRRWIRSVCARALKKLDERGYPMTAADMQAVLWYPEKEIYGRLTNRKVEGLNLSYDEALARIAQNEGVERERIRQALLSVGENGRRGPEDATSTRSGQRQPAEGPGRRAA